MKQYQEPKRNRVISVRMDGDLYDWIERLASSNTRTMSHQVEHLLKLARELLKKTDDVDNVSIVREVLAASRYEVNNKTHKKES
jgi:hypothetical protein